MQIGLEPGLDDFLGVRPEVDHPLLAVVLDLVGVGRYSQILPCMLMSMARMMHASPGRQADQICRLTMARTGGVTKGSMAAMRSSGTALTGGLSIASPIRRPSTEQRARHTVSGTISRATPHLNTWRMRPTCWLIRLRQIAGLDQLQAAGDQGQRAEAGDRLGAVELPDGAQGRLEAADLAGGLAVFDVPLLGVLPEGQDQLVDL